MSVLGMHGVMMGASGSSVLWTPAHLAVQPSIWLDWDSSVTDVSGYASEWANKGIAGGVFSQPTSGNRPSIISGAIGGKRALSFDGANDILRSGSISVLQGQKAWHFVVFKKRSGSTPTWGAIPTWAHRSDNVNKMGVALQPLGANSNKPYLYAHPGNSGGAQPGIMISPAVIAEWDMLCLFLEWNGGTATARRNGATEGTQSCPTTNAGASAPTAFSIGAGLNTGSPIDGTFADIDVALVMWGDAWSSGDAERIEGWAAWQLGLEGNLPAGHPYKSSPPMA